MSQSRVLSIRFSEEEYRALQALSLITDKAVNAIVREAVVERANSAGRDPKFQQLADEARRRLDEADRQIRNGVLGGE